LTGWPFPANGHAEAPFLLETARMSRLITSVSSLAFALVLATGCAAMHEAHRRHVHESLSFAPNADLADYGRITLLPLECGGPLCEADHVRSVLDGSGMALSRVGYDVYDYERFEQLMVRSYQAVVVEETTTTETTTTTGHAGGGIHMAMTGDEMGGSVSVTATDPETGETIHVGVSAGLHGAHATVATEQQGSATTHTTVTRTVPSVIVYEELPVAKRTWVLAESGIHGVVTGRVVVSEPDDVTGFVSVRTHLRMGDAETGQMVWQFEWEDTAHDGRPDIPEAIARTVMAFEEAHRMHMGLPPRNM
jgi:hypothetical protein